MKCKFIVLNLCIIFITVQFVNCSNEFRNDFDLPKGILANALEEFDWNEASLRTYTEDVVKKNLMFQYFKNGAKIYEDRGLEGNMTNAGCSPSDKFGFILHGWGQSCEEEWVKKLIEKLTIHRGGCIVCVDYGFYKKDSYLRMLRFFRPMTNTISAKIQQLKTEGMEASKIFMFGFSLGGQMATAIGKLMGPKAIKQIDTCDMAGPGFDFRKTFDYRDSAEMVKCWHTSRNKGTRFYSCHQNVRFGNCGYNQPGESPLITSHGLCTHFYINSFDHPFYAAEPPAACIPSNPALSLPNNYTVGYTEEIRPEAMGEIFVPTGKKSPYNLPLEQVLKLNTQSRGNNQVENNQPRRPYRRRFPIFFMKAMSRIFNMMGY